MRISRKDLVGVILIAAIIGTLFAITGCSTSRQMEKERFQAKSDCTSVEKQVTQNDITSEVNSQLSATTETTETIDTIVNIANPETRKFIQIPVYMKRETKRQEYFTTQEVKKDMSQSALSKEIREKKAILNETKQVVAKRPNITLYIVIAGSVLIVLLFVFFWKRIPFARIFDLFKP